MASDGYTAANKRYFDSHVHIGPLAEKVARAICNAALENYDFDANETTVLDFACGSGI
jgi:hypothetical protein